MKHDMSDVQICDKVPYSFGVRGYITGHPFYRSIRNICYVVTCEEESDVYPF